MLDVERGGCQTGTPTAIVIGAGFGGISAAGRLARAGYSVTCIEMHATPGGRCCEILEQGHRFDVGPSIILVPSAYREAFTAMGDDLDRHLEFLRIDPTYKIHFHDGTSLELTADLQRMEAQLESFERGAFKSFLALLRQGHDNLHKTLAAIAHRLDIPQPHRILLNLCAVAGVPPGCAQLATSALTDACFRTTMLLRVRAGDMAAGALRCASAVYDDGKEGGEEAFRLVSCGRPHARRDAGSERDAVRVGAREIVCRHRLAARQLAAHASASGRRRVLCGRHPKSARPSGMRAACDARAVLSLTGLRSRGCRCALPAKTR